MLVISVVSGLITGVSSLVCMNSWPGPVAPCAHNAEFSLCSILSLQSINIIRSVCFWIFVRFFVFISMLLIQYWDGLFSFQLWFLLLLFNNLYFIDSVNSVYHF